MKNNIKKAPVKFREDLLYFQHFMLIFVIITTLMINILGPYCSCYNNIFNFISVFSLLQSGTKIQT